MYHGGFKIIYIFPYYMYIFLSTNDMLDLNFREEG